MISHTVLLISNALCEFKDEIPELKDIMEKCQPDDIDGLIQEFMRLRIINTMKRVTNGYLYKNRNHDSLKQVKASLTKAFNNKRNEFAKSEQNWKVIAEMISLGGSNDELSSCLEELGTLKSIDNAPELNDQLLTTECKKLTELYFKPRYAINASLNPQTHIRQPYIKEFDTCEDVAKLLISKMESEDSFLIKFVKMFENWYSKVLPNDTSPKPPNSIGSLILQWCCDRLFGVQPLGLGEPFNSANENSAFESDEWNLVKSVTPPIFSDLAGVTNRGVENRENTAVNMFQNGTIGYGSIYESFKRFLSYPVTMADNDSSFEVLLSTAFRDALKIERNDIIEP